MQIDILPFNAVLHDRQHFDCGVPALNRYFKEQVAQDSKRNVTSCFVAVTVAQAQVVGFYTLAASSILLTDLPEAQAKKLPRYPNIPAVRMGRLAIDRHYQGQRLGNALLADAQKRSSTADFAVYALVVDAKDAQAAAFYAHHGFNTLRGQALAMYCPLTKL